MGSPAPPGPLPGAPGGGRIVPAGHRDDAGAPDSVAAAPKRMRPHLIVPRRAGYTNVAPFMRMRTGRCVAGHVHAPRRAAARPHRGRPRTETRERDVQTAVRPASAGRPAKGERRLEARDQQERRIHAGAPAAPRVADVPADPRGELPAGPPVLPAAR